MFILHRIVRRLTWAALISGVAALGPIQSSAEGLADGLEEGTWSLGPDPSVSAMAQAGETLYLAGAFSSIGPSTGSGILTSDVDGRPGRKAPKVVGQIRCVVADGRGGWYLGGEFLGVGGVRHRNLAHVLPNGRVDSWDPAPDGGIRTLTVSDGVLYVGGDFHQVAGQPRRSAAAFDEDTGQLTAWDPSPDGNLWVMLASERHLHSKCVEQDDRVIFIGGEFATIGGQTRANLAAVDAHTGRANAWDPEPDYRVRALAQQEDTLFIGGNFYNVGGQFRKLLAAVDVRDGRLLAWNADITRATDWPYDGGPRVTALGVSGRTLYVAGAFSSMSGQPRNGLGAVDVSSGMVTSWDPQAVGWGPERPWEPYFEAMLVHGRSVYVGGEFFSLAGRDGGADGVRFAGAVDAKTGASRAWNPRPNSPVAALGYGYGSIYVGGNFTSAWDWLPRAGLAAVDLTTGAATSWAPSTDGLVRALVVSGQTLVLAGQFSSVNGQPRSNIAALDLGTGAVKPWNPNADGWIYALAASGSNIYVGGWFSNIGGQPRNCLAALDTASGAASAWNPHPNDIVLSLATRGTTVYAGGFFSIAGGARRSCVAALDGVSGSALNWAPLANDVVDAIAVQGDQAFLGGYFSAINGQPRLGLASVNAATGELAAWAADTDHPVHALAADAGALYAGGDFATVGGRPQAGIAALDLQTGSLLPWAADADGVVLSLVADGARVCAGGTFRRVGFTPSAGVAVLPAARGNDQGGQVLAVDPVAGARFHLAQNEPNPVLTHTIIRFEILEAGTPVHLSVFDLQGRRVAAPLTGQPQASGVHDVRLETAGWPPGCYLYRLDTGGMSATRKMVVVK